MKIDFTKIEVQVSFDGTRKTFNIAKNVGNDMMYNGSVIKDIGFEELARQIYFSDGEVEIPPQYIQSLLLFYSASLMARSRLASLRSCSAMILISSS